MAQRRAPSVRARGGMADFAPWSETRETVASKLETNIQTGLSDAGVAAARAKYGYNELDKEEGKSMWELVMEQFEDKLVRILLLAAIVSFALIVMEEGFEHGIVGFIEPIVILTILVLNAIVGVWQERNAENALEALKEMASATAKVMRNGELVPELPAKELVPGDVVQLRVGDKVPADMRVWELRTATFRCEQSALTGESVAVNKDSHAVKDADCEIQAKECMCFSGTSVANGSSIGIVTQIGMKTEIGKIQSQIQQAAEEQDDSPLKQKIDEFGEQLANVIFYICVLVWAINYKHFLLIKWVGWNPFGGGAPSFDLMKCTYYFKIAVALAVAAIPEGLPAVITTCLALGTRKMAKKNAIVRKLPSVETLGCTTVICSDKTGTLTTNQMSVIKLVAMGSQSGALRAITVTGSSYNPQDGKVQADGLSDPNLTKIAEVCSLCNDSTLKKDENGRYACVGAPTEAALRVLVEKLIPGASGSEDEPANTQLARKYQKRAVLEFDRDRKSMSSIVSQGGSNQIFVKGAPENVFTRCSGVQLQDGSVVDFDARMQAAVKDAVLGMSKEALRCLAMAYKRATGELETYDGPQHSAQRLLQDPANYAGIESDLILCGLTGLQDPPRKEVKPAIQLSREAGIRVMMITGDNKDTAEAIAAGVGIFADGESPQGKSITGRDFMKLSEDEQVSFLGTGQMGGRVFSRAEPKTKQDIIRLLKQQGEIAAMTGDGVNDAPALKLADIGVAMGIAGTEVAKEASDMVLADDNFSTIVAAVEEGRSIYANMKAFIRYMISSNIGEVASIFLVAMLGLPEGMNPVQLLWVNLVTDGPPATALGFNPPDPHVMRKPPRRKDDNLITRWVFFRYMVIGAYVGIATVGIFYVWFTMDSFLGVDLSGDKHTTVTPGQLFGWASCSDGKGVFENTNFTGGSFTAGGTEYSFSGCDYFGKGKVKAMTLSLSVLVSIEMFNAFNALSEDGSLLTVPPWVNPYLIIASGVSIALHCVIMYVPVFCPIFTVVPLSKEEWSLVVVFGFPVILIDEVLKFFGRRMMEAEIAERRSLTE